MSPRPITLESENPFKDIDKWIKDSSNGNLLSWFFRNAIKDMKISENTYQNMLDSFISDPLHGIGNCSQERSTFKGNTAKDIRNPRPSWNKFLFLMKVINFKDIRMTVSIQTAKGTKFQNSVYIPLEGINVLSDYRYLDPRNLYSQELPKKESRKILREDILNASDKFVDSSLDEMAFLTRSALISANIGLIDWCECMNGYVEHLDRAKRCTERNNFTSQVLLSQTSTWKRYMKFLRFIKTKFIKIEMTCTSLDPALGERYYSLVVPFSR